MIRHMWWPLAALFVASAGCSGRPSAPPPTQQAQAEAPNADRIPVSDEPPAALVQLGQSATDLFDAAGSSDWGRASASLQAVNDARSNLAADLPNPDIVAQLETRLVSVRDATNDRRQLETMEAANAITQIAAELSLAYRSEVPYEVKMLGYYGRQIELGIASGNATVSKRATTDLVATWHRIEPTIERRGHLDDARRFSDIVVALMDAKRAADFSGPARDELAAARHLESIFSSPL
jgi:hypothetical protein